VIGGSPSAGLGTKEARRRGHRHTAKYLEAFNWYLQTTFPGAPPQVVDVSMAKATAGVASRCAAMQVRDADIVIVELLHDEPYSSEEAHQVPGGRCALRAAGLCACAGPSCGDISRACSAAGMP
jgi:hypothetical protein